MNESDSNEQVSAFIDGELQGSARDRVVDALYESPNLRRAWARFHLIGDAVRQVGPVPGACSIAGKVGEALSGERIGLVRPRSRRRGMELLPGLALAASVAGLAILGIRGIDDDGGVQSPPLAESSRHEVPMATPTPAISDPAVSRIASTTAQPAGPETARLQWSDVAPDAEARLNAYLVNHNEYAGNGMRGVLPYVRIVGYQSFAGDYH